MEVKRKVGEEERRKERQQEEKKERGRGRPDTHERAEAFAGEAGVTLTGDPQRPGRAGGRGGRGGREWAA